MLKHLKQAIERVLGGPAIEEADLLRRVLDLRQKGVLLEIGAHNGDGTFMSYVDAGWEVHAFEPDPNNRAELLRKTVGLPNVTVIPKAVADKPGMMTLYTSSESTGISSLAAFTEGHAPSEEVEVITIRDYVAAGGPARVDFLKMDVEGYERFVMAGYPWDTHRPRAVLLEFEDRKTVPLGYSWSDLAQDLKGRGYDVLVSEWHPIERYGVAHTWRRFAEFPTELLDDDAWGNLIAVEPADMPKLRRASRIAPIRLRGRKLVDRARGR